MTAEDPWPPTDPGRRRHLLANLAHGYFVEGASKISLGKRSGLSRFQVARRPGRPGPGRSPGDHAGAPGRGHPRDLLVRRPAARGEAPPQAAAQRYRPARRCPAHGRHHGERVTAPVRRASQPHRAAPVGAPRGRPGRGPEEVSRDRRSAETGGLARRRRARHRRVVAGHLDRVAACERGPGPGGGAGRRGGRGLRPPP